MKKKLLAILLTLACVFASASPVYAQNNTRYGSTVQANENGLLRWSYFITISNSLSINGGTATMTMAARARSPINYTSVSSKLQRQVNGSWVDVASYSNYENSLYVSMSKTKTGLAKGYTYRLYSTFTAKESGSTRETVNVSDSYYY